MNRAQSAIARSRRQADALAAVVRTAYAFQEAQRLLDEAMLDNLGVSLSAETLLVQDRDDRQRELFAALDDYAPLRPHER